MKENLLRSYLNENVTHAFTPDVDRPSDSGLRHRFAKWDEKCSTTTEIENKNKKKGTATAAAAKLKNGAHRN